MDYGTRRVGLAIADPLRLFAQPWVTCSPADAVVHIKKLHEQESIATAVVGWPLMEDGTECEATRRVDLFIQRLAKLLTNVKFVRWDERYTSEEAKDRLKGRLRGGDRGRIDMMAAGIILQEYLDACETPSDS